VLTEEGSRCEDTGSDSTEPSIEFCLLRTRHAIIIPKMPITMLTTPNAKLILSVFDRTGRGLSSFSRYLA
jgi:hypothetical protein